MQRVKLISSTAISALVCVLLIALCSTAKTQDPPFLVKDNLFDQANQDNLGLTAAEGTETITVFAPSDTTDKFSNGVVMIAFKDYLYCMWQSSAKDEDAEDTWVAYSRSQDGKNWSDPDTLAATIENGYSSSGGWWVAGDTLVGYINTWPNSISPRGGYTRYTTSTDGLTWSEPKALLMNNGDTLKGIFEQDPHALPDGRIINAAHFQPGLLVSPIYTDDPSGIRAWTRSNYTNMPGADELSREIEPSWFLRSDDTIVMTFRDQQNSFKRLASVSGDRGESWSVAVLTDMPDSRSKQSCGNLADSAAFMVGNPVNNKTRIPLAVTLSPNGKFFNTAYVLREGGDSLQPLRYEGRAKRLGYAYPKSMVYEDYLYVAYATNKEDVEYTKVPLASMVLDTSTMNPPIIDNVSSTISESNTIEILFNANGIINISIQNYTNQGNVSIYNLNGQLIYSTEINNNEVQYNTSHLPIGTYIVVVRTQSERKTQLFQNW
jgi:hypothetical protein